MEKHGGLFAAIEAEWQRQEAGDVDIGVEIEQRAILGAHEAFRNVTRDVCGLEVYERLKELFITQTEYWRIEEAFARTTLELLLDYYAQEHQQRLQLSDLLDLVHWGDPPTLALFKRLWSEHFANAQQATPSPSPSHRISKPKPKTTSKRRSRRLTQRPPSESLGSKNSRRHTHTALPPSSRTRSKTQARSSR